MLNILSQNPLQFIIVAILILLAISIHEFSHAYAADRLGDPTAQLAGRLTLNPFKHLDPIGTLLLLFVGFGWGKPVPFDPFNLRNPKKDSAIISFAGPFSNFVMAIASSILIRILIINPSFPANFLLSEILISFLHFNVLLGVFNLIPISPLDGFKVVAGILPRKYYEDWLGLERYGYLILLFLIFPFFGSSPVFSFLSPVVNFIVSILIPGSIGGTI